MTWMLVRLFVGLCCDDNDDDDEEEEEEEGEVVDDCENMFVKSVVLIMMRRMRGRGEGFDMKC